MREHVPYRAGAFAFVRREHVVEFKHAREKHGERLSGWALRKVSDSPREYRKREELAIIEQLVPVPVPVVQDLARVVPIGDRHPWEWWIEASQALPRSLECGQIVVGDLKVLFWLRRLEEPASRKAGDPEA